MPSSTLARALDILSIFSLEKSFLRIEDITDKYGYTRSTAYRYVKELCDAGLLSPFHDARYTLGPRIIELERQLVLTDPLYRAGQAILPTLRHENGVLLLHNLYRDRVLCILNEGPETLRYGEKSIQVRRARGMPFSLFQGAGSLALLAYLSPNSIRQTYLQHSDDIAANGLGENWRAFRTNMAGIRQKGYAISKGQITPFLGGIAVPILLPNEKRVIGSLALAFPLEMLTETLETDTVQQLKDASQKIAQAYLQESS